LKYAYIKNNLYY